MLQADGGTRTAAITGAYVALARRGDLSVAPPAGCRIRGRCRARSPRCRVGVVDGRVRVDLPYTEDSRAEVDMNVVATDTGTLVEIQGTGEGATFPRSTLDKMLDLALVATASSCSRFSARRWSCRIPVCCPSRPTPAKKAFGS